MSDETTEETTEPTAVGHSGLEQLDQEPMSDADQHDPNKVGPASAPAPQAQSGVALPEDAAAGVEAGVVPEPPEAPEVAGTPGL